MHSGANNGGIDCEAAPPDELHWTNGDFVLFDDGFVVFTHSGAERCDLRQAQLPPGQAEALVARFVMEGLTELPCTRRIDAYNGHGARGSFIMIRLGDVWHWTSMSGMNRFGEIYGRERDEPPMWPVIDALSVLARFDPPGSVPYSPESLDVWLSVPPEYEPAPTCASEAWPPNLPRPTAPLGARQFRVTYSSALEPVARAFVLGGSGHRLVELDGRTWRVGLVLRELPEHAYVDDVRDTFVRMQHAAGVCP